MYRIESDYDYDETIERLENAIIQYEYLYPGTPGFVGHMDSDKGTLWIVNHMNTFNSRRGIKYRSYRRFKGYVDYSRNTAFIEGDFFIRPIYKISIIMETLFFLTLIIFYSLNIPDLIQTIKMTLVSILLVCTNIGIIMFNIRKSEEFDEEILDFIECIISQGGNDE